MERARFQSTIKLGDGTVAKLIIKDDYQAYITPSGQTLLLEIRDYDHKFNEIGNLYVTVADEDDIKDFKRDFAQSLVFLIEAESVIEVGDGYDVKVIPVAMIKGSLQYAEYVAKTRAYKHFCKWYDQYTFNDIPAVITQADPDLVRQFTQFYKTHVKKMEKAVQS